MSKHHQCSVFISECLCMYGMYIAMYTLHSVRMFCHLLVPNFPKPNPTALELLKSRLTSNFRRLHSIDYTRTV